MRRLLATTSLVLPLLAVAATPARSQEVTIRVEAGAHDRHQTPVRALLDMPKSFERGKAVVLRSEGRPNLAGQITGPSLLAEGSESADDRRELHFILPELAAGESAEFRVAPVLTDVRFTWKETDEGDLLAEGGRPVMLYVRPEFDDSTPEARDLTFKPFHHLFAPDGRRVTKGPGGLYTHHRGLFFGYNRVSYGDGKQADVWHGRGKAYQSHEETLAQEAGPVLGRNRVRIDWHGQEGETFAEETREVTAYATQGGRLFEFAARVETTVGPVMLDGDPQHAGVHFRADQHVADVTKGQTYYLRPDGKGQPGETRNWEPKTGQGPVNLPWNAMSFVIDGDRYTAVYLDHPENPKEARYSERDYGRFGSYFEYQLTEDRPLEVRYRLWLQEGELTVEQAAALDADFDDPVTVRVVD